MPPVMSPLAMRVDSFRTIGRRAMIGIGLTVALHVAALCLLFASEDSVTAWLLFIGAWALLNFFWLLLTRRPGVSAAVSLAMVVALMALSRFKSDNFWMTVSFIDVMVIDSDTISFLFA